MIRVKQNGKYYITDDNALRLRSNTNVVAQQAAATTTPVSVQPPITVTPTPEPVAPPITVTPTPEPVAPIQSVQPPIIVTPTPEPVAPPITVTPTPEPVAPPITVTPTPEPVSPPTVAPTPDPDVMIETVYITEFLTAFQINAAVNEDIFDYVTKYDYYIGVFSTDLSNEPESTIIDFLKQNGNNGENTVSNQMLTFASNAFIDLSSTATNTFEYDTTYRFYVYVESPDSDQTSLKYTSIPYEEKAYYKIVNYDSNIEKRIMDAHETTPHTAFVRGRNQNDDTQLWKVTKSENMNEYTIQQKRTMRYLDTDENNPNYALTSYVNYSQLYSQVWTLSGEFLDGNIIDGNEYRLTQKNSGRHLDLDSDDAVYPHFMITSEYEDISSQKWIFNFVPQ
jgi:hypothetical protein